MKQSKRNRENRREVAGAENGEPTHRWLVRFVLVPLAVALVAGGYFLARPSDGPEPVRGELLSPGTLALLSVEAEGELKSRHNEVVQRVANGDLAGALQVCTAVLNDHPASPRANYNQACIYSLLAQRSEQLGLPDEVTRHVERAQIALRTALDFGITNYIKLNLNCPEPMSWIQNDADLDFLLARSQGAQKLVVQHSGEDLPKVYGGGGGCVGAGMRVLLPSGEGLAIERLEEGADVCAWDAVARRMSTARVNRVYRHNAEVLIVINDELEFTPSHPILTSEGWLPAGEVSVGVHLMLASGKTMAVKTVNAARGRFKVFDLEVNELHTFVVEGVVVHNKLSL